MTAQEIQLKKAKAIYVPVPVFEKVTDEELVKLVKGEAPAKSLKEKRQRAVSKFYSALRFPDSSIDIPFTE